MKKILLATACVVALNGCAMDGRERETIGTGLGGVIGGLVGAQFGSGAGQLVAVAAGTAAGAFVGNRIGAMLDESERQAVAANSNEALSHAADGERVVWRNPQTGAQAVMTPRDTRQVEERVKIIREKEVAPPPQLEIMGTTYVATTDSNVRAAPGTDNKIVAGLGEGERVQVIGKVVGANWYMVGRNDRSIGYVYAPLLAEAPPVRMASHVPRDQSAPQTEPGAQAAAAPSTDRPKAVRPAIDLDEALAGDNAAIDLDAEGLVVEEVAAVRTCRTLDLEVSKRGTSTAESLETCKAADGAWEIM